MSEFKSKTVLITGGSSGIGRATAIAFGKLGANVVVSSRREKEGEETAQLVNEAGGVGYFVKADVAKVEDIKNLIQQTVAKFGGLDYAFNNAGIEGEVFVPTAEFSENVWDDVIRINLTGVFLSMKYEIPEMLKQGKGAIVNMSSIAGMKGSAISVAYTASKHGVIGATRTAAHEYSAQGIRVNAVSPAVIKTDMTDRAGFFDDAETEERMSAMHPIGRCGSVDEVAEAVVWLCSDKSSFITGHALPVDGGFMS